MVIRRMTVPGVSIAWTTRDLTIEGASRVESIWPVWEVFDARDGATIGFSRGSNYEAAIGTVAELAARPQSHLDADLVPLERLDAVGTGVPRLVKPQGL